MKLHWTIPALLLAVGLGITAPAAAQLCEGSAGDAQVAQALLMDTERLARFRQKHALDNSGVCAQSASQFLNRNFALDAPNPVVLEQTYRSQRLAEQRDEFGEIYADGLGNAQRARERLVRNGVQISLEVTAWPLPGAAPTRAIRACNNKIFAAVDDLGLYHLNGNNAWEAWTQSLSVAGNTQSVSTAGLTFNQIEANGGACDLLVGESVYRGSTDRKSFTLQTGTTDSKAWFFRLTGQNISQVNPVSTSYSGYLRLGPLDGQKRLWLPARSAGQSNDTVFAEDIARDTRNVTVMDRSNALAPCPFLDVIVVGTLRVVADACGHVFGYSGSGSTATTSILGTIHASYPIHEFRDAPQFWAPSIRLGSWTETDGNITLLALTNVETCVAGQACTYEKRLYRCTACLTAGLTQGTDKVWSLWAVFDRFDERYATANILAVLADNSIWVGGYDVWRKLPGTNTFNKMSDGEQAPFGSVPAGALYLPHGQRDLGLFDPQAPAVATSLGLWQWQNNRWAAFTNTPSAPATAIAAGIVDGKRTFFAAGRNLGTHRFNQNAWVPIAGGDGTSVALLPPAVTSPTSTPYLLGNFAHLNPFRKRLDNDPLSQYLPVDTTLRGGLPVDRLTPTEYAPPLLVVSDGATQMALAGGKKIWAGINLTQPNQGTWLEVTPRTTTCTGNNWLQDDEYITALAWQSSTNPTVWIGTSLGRIGKAQPFQADQLCPNGNAYLLAINIATTNLLNGRVNRIACIGNACFALRAGYSQAYQCLSGGCSTCQGEICTQMAYALVQGKTAGTYWLGTETGLYEIEGTTIKAIQLNGAPGNLRINDIVNAGSGCYAFATSAGIYVTQECQQ